MKALQGLLICLLVAIPCAALDVVSYAASDMAPYADVNQKSSSDLQRRADQASGVECARLSMQAARQLLENANRLFVAGDVKDAHDAIDGSLRYVRRSVDCSVQARKGEKATEINLRMLIHRMKDVLQTLDSEDRPHLSRSIIELEKQRDRLLRAIFGAAAGGGAPEKEKKKP
jgi:hypothetical protein